MSPNRRRWGLAGNDSVLLKGGMNGDPPLCGRNSGCVLGLLDSDFFSFLDLNNLRIMDSDLHDAVTQRSDVLSHNLQPWFAVSTRALSALLVVLFHWVTQRFNDSSQE
jgi:hypothetical protein